MKIKPVKRIPALIVFGVLLLFGVLSFFKIDLFERVERMTFDMRARAALRHPEPVATNLGFVFINEESVQTVWDGSLGFSFGLFWPRQVYGRLVDELSRQGAKAVAFDVLFGELRPDHSPVPLEGAETNLVESDNFFAEKMRRAGNAIIAVTTDKIPPPLFLTNALAAADITTEKDSDGILRRVKVFRNYYTHWHRIFRQLERQEGVSLEKARFEPGRLILPRRDGEEIKVPLNEDGTFNVSGFLGDKIPSGMAPRDKPCETKRVWHLGVVLAALELKLDLDHAQIDLPRGRITLTGPAGLKRTLPVDQEGYFYIDWSMPPDHPSLSREPIHVLLAQNHDRLLGNVENLSNHWRGKLAIVGSSAVVGNNLTDVGATPLSEHTLLVAKHWNVANSIITGRFVRRANSAGDLGLIALLTLAVALLTWQARILRASFYVGLIFVVFIVIAFVAYIGTRFWIPMVFPLLSGLVAYIALIAWRLVFEEAERRRIKSIFGTVVSEKVMNVLLDSPNLALGGARRQITVMFADVRGFTELTDKSQDKATEVIRKKNLTGEAAEARYDEQARQTLETVNLYLGLVADTILKQDATLDKFIGDCVMAFWGAPADQPNHAVACVRAAIEAQRAIYELNLKRSTENQKLEIENLARVSAGLEPKPMLPVLLMGSGINTGMTTVGLMGSGAKQKNYTVFGREVNLASRLEGLSGRGRIFIGEATYQELLRRDPTLAATCVLQEPKNIKGFSANVTVFEVPWRRPGESEQDIETQGPGATDSTVITSIIQRA